MSPMSLITPTAGTSPAADLTAGLGAPADGEPGAAPFDEALAAALAAAGLTPPVAPTLPAPALAGGTSAAPSLVEQATTTPLVEEAGHGRPETPAASMAQPTTPAVVAEAAATPFVEEAGHGRHETPAAAAAQPATPATPAVVAEAAATPFVEEAARGRRETPAAAAAQPATPATPATPASPATTASTSSVEEAGHGRHETPATATAQPVTPEAAASPSVEEAARGRHETSAAAPAQPATPATPNAQSPAAAAAAAATAITPTAPVVTTPQSGVDRAVVTQVFPEVTRITTDAAKGPNGTHRITLTLQPEQLGDVRVTLTVRDGAVQVRLAGGAGDGAVQQALAAGAPDLQRLLERSGADARVLVRDAFPDSLGQSPDRSSSQGQQGQQNPQPGQHGFGDTGRHLGGGERTGWSRFESERTTGSGARGAESVTPSTAAGSRGADRSGRLDRSL